MDPVVCKNTALEGNRPFQLLRIVTSQHLFITCSDDIKASGAQDVRDQDGDILIQVEGSEEFQRLTAGCTR